jgi:hypothetical protein
LGSAARPSQAGGFDSVRETTSSRLDQQPRWIKSEADAEEARAVVRITPGEPFTADAAVQIALINNAACRLPMQSWDSRRDVVEAGRLRNPGFSFARLHRADEIEIDRTFLFDILGLIHHADSYRPGNSAGSSGHRGALRGNAASCGRHTTCLGGCCLGAETVKYMQQVKEAAEASAELARRMAAG